LRENRRAFTAVLFRGSRTEVDELPAQSRRDANKLALPEHHLLALYQQCELTLEHQIHLLLVLVAVDASTLA
jgi:hypothetical protein